MAQPSVTAFFNSRKRAASDEIRNKAKVLVLERPRVCQRQEQPSPLTPVSEESQPPSSPKLVYRGTSSAVRNLEFDSSSTTTTPRAAKRARIARSRNFSAEQGQTDIRATFLKMGAAAKQEPKTVTFEKMGPLSPKKKCRPTPTKEPVEATRSNSHFMDRLARQDTSLAEIKNKINRSSRLAELKASIARIKSCQEKLEQFERQDELKKPHIKKFDQIQLEVPLSPSKVMAHSPSKSMQSPTKSIKLPESASPQRRLRFAPKETTSKASPTKAPAYQRLQSLVDSGTPALPLPHNYRFLAEAFRCVDTVAAMLFNRKEVITFKKLKPAVQELVRRNFTLQHLAQIKSIYPDAFVYNQEKLRNFGSSSKQERYELVLTPLDGLVKSGDAPEMSMGPGVMLERRRKFYGALLDEVKNEHDKFLLGLESPMRIPKDKITRWHPEFDVESCRAIQLAELPEAPSVEKAHSATQVLEKAKSLFNCNTRMEKALQRLADAKMTSNSSSVADAPTSDQQPPRNVEISVVDNTPPTTPTTHQSAIPSSALKGIPKALLERVRAKQAAKALEAMTRTPTADREAALHSRLPEMAKILRNIFVAEKKSVLPLESVIVKLDNSYRTKLTPNELEEHVRLMCKLMPTFACLQKVRLVDYLKIAKTADIVKVVKRLEIIANDKLKS